MYLIIVGSLLGFLLIVRAMLVRSADTAGSSADVVATVPVEPVIQVGGIERIDDTPILYKCVNTGELVSYQSSPCAPGERTVAVQAVRPDSAWDVAHARQQLREARLAAARMARIAGTDRWASGFSTGGSALDARRAGCIAAKENRESVLRTVGLRRTYDLLQQLDATVNEACKGVF